MPLLDVALVTCAAYPALHPDDQLLLPALARRGLRAIPAVWDDPAVDWAGVRLAVLRATWDYYLRRSAFLAWATRIAGGAPSGSRLENPLPIVTWNSHKGYLRDLAQRGVPVIPTLWLEAGTPADLASLLAAQGWERAVLKPMVSADAYATILVTPANVAAGQAHLNRLLPSAGMMVQPFMASVATEGERSLMFIDGVLTHAVRRPPRLGPDAGAGDVCAAVTPAADEAALARAILRLVPAPLLYARVDLVRDAAGAPRLMELELVEPSLFLLAAPGAVERLADAILARVAGTG